MQCFMRCPHAIRHSELLDSSQFVTRTHTNAIACPCSNTGSKLCGEKQPSVCDNSSFTVSTNNLQASLPITRTGVYIQHIHRETKKAPRTWSAKTNPQLSLNKSSPCNGEEIPLKEHNVSTMSANMAAAALRLNICVKLQVLWMCAFTLTPVLSSLSNFIPVLRFKTVSKFG